MRITLVAGQAYNLVPGLLPIICSRKQTDPIVGVPACDVVDVWRVVKAVNWFREGRQLIWRDLLSARVCIFDIAVDWLDREDNKQCTMFLYNREKQDD